MEAGLHKMGGEQQLKVAGQRGHREERGSERRWQNWRWREAGGQAGKAPSDTLRSREIPSCGEQGAAEGL